MSTGAGGLFCFVTPRVMTKFGYVEIGDGSWQWMEPVPPEPYYMILAAAAGQP